MLIKLEYVISVVIVFDMMEVGSFNSLLIYKNMIMNNIFELGEEIMNSILIEFK